MKKLNVVGLALMGLLGFAGISTSAKADVQKLDKTSMASITGGSPFFHEEQDRTGCPGAMPANCSTQIGVHDKYYGMFQTDSPQLYTACVLAWTTAGCNNTMIAVCTYRDIYDGQTDCQNRNGPVKSHQESTTDAMSGIAPDPNIPDFDYP